MSDSPSPVSLGEKIARIITSLTLVASTLPAPAPAGTQTNGPQKSDKSNSRIHTTTGLIPPANQGSDSTSPQCTQIPFVQQSEQFVTTMVQNHIQAVLLQTVKEALWHNEIGGDKSLIYSISNAGYGSGYTFGITQEDLYYATGPLPAFKDLIDLAKTADPKDTAKLTDLQIVFRDILLKTQDESGLTPSHIKEIMHAVTEPGYQDTVKHYKKQIDKALQSSYGMAQTDALDNEQFNELAQTLRTIIHAAQNNPHADGGGIFSNAQLGSPDSIRALAMVTMGANMYEPDVVLKDLLDHLAGVDHDKHHLILNDGLVDKLPGVHRPITLQDVETVFGQQRFFMRHPDNYATFKDNANKVAEALTPTMLSTAQVEQQARSDFVHLYRANQDQPSTECISASTAPNTPSARTPTPRSVG